MITVYFDGKCGLCAREINHYRRIAPHGVFIWRDVTLYSTGLAELGVSRVEALRLLHATDSTGQRHVGVDAFILIWRQLGPGWRLLARLVGAGPIKPIAKHLYIRFADWRFSRLSHCQIAAREEDEAHG